MKPLHFIVFSTCMLIVSFGCFRLPQASGQNTISRKQAAKQMTAGNWKNAYQGFAASACNPHVDPTLASEDLQNALTCLDKLDEEDKRDDLREQAIAAHPMDWRVLLTAAESYDADFHDGYLIAGHFYRGFYRDGGKAVHAAARDHVRALQLMQQAAAQLVGKTTRKDVGDFFWRFSCMLNDSTQASWKLQALTDLTELPDYDDEDDISYHGAPVQSDGTPVYYAIPASWEAARNDGERWRWTLQQCAMADPKPLPGLNTPLPAF